MLAQEFRHSRQQAFYRKGRLYPEVQNLTGTLQGDALRRLGDRSESVAQGGQVCEAGPRQFERPVDAAKQFDAELILERLDMLAHRTGRNTQFVGGLFVAEMPGRRLECP